HLPPQLTAPPAPCPYSGRCLLCLANPTPAASISSKSSAACKPRCSPISPSAASSSTPPPPAPPPSITGSISSNVTSLAATEPLPPSSSMPTAAVPARSTSPSSTT